MSWTCNPASAIALRLASAARLIVVTPDLRENAVHPIPTIAVLSLIDCSAMFYPALCVALLSFRAQREIQDASLSLGMTTRLLREELRLSNLSWKKSPSIASSLR